MNEENRDVKIDAGSSHEARYKQSASTVGAGRSKRLRLWLNWALALLTVLSAGFVMVYFFSAVMSTAACGDKQCQHAEPNWISPNVLLYGPPVVAALTVFASLSPAHRRWGILVPVVALARLAAALGFLAI